MHKIRKSQQESILDNKELPLQAPAKKSVKNDTENFPLPGSVININGDNTIPAGSSSAANDDSMLIVIEEAPPKKHHQTNKDKLHPYSILLNSQFTTHLKSKNDANRHVKFYIPKETNWSENITRLSVRKKNLEKSGLLNRMDSTEIDSELKLEHITDLYQLKQFLAHHKNKQKESVETSGQNVFDSSKKESISEIGLHTFWTSEVRVWAPANMLKRKWIEYGPQSWREAVKHTHGVAHDIIEDSPEKYDWGEVSNSDSDDSASDDERVTVGDGNQIEKFRESDDGTSINDKKYDPVTYSEIFLVYASWTAVYVIFILGRFSIEIFKSSLTGGQDGFCSRFDSQYCVDYTTNKGHKAGEVLRSQQVEMDAMKVPDNSFAIGRLRSVELYYLPLIFLVNAILLSFSIHFVIILLFDYEKMFDWREATPFDFAVRVLLPLIVIDFVVVKMLFPYIAMSAYSADGAMSGEILRCL